MHRWIRRSLTVALSLCAAPLSGVLAGQTPVSAGMPAPASVARPAATASSPSPTAGAPRIPDAGIFAAASASFGLPSPGAIRNVQVLPLDPESDEAKRLAEGLPLVPERLLRMTVTEGTWMSVDVSPDGGTVVFDLLGSIWTVPITGGKATPLTQGMAFDAQPRFSPDGSRVVFTSDRSGGENVWMMSMDRADTVQLTRGNNNAYQSPTFSPDGRYVVVTREAGAGQGKLWMYHVDGGSGTALITEPANLRTTGAQFAQDGRLIWYAQRTGSWTYNSPMSEYQLAVYDRETGETRTESSRFGGAIRPTVSPDGRWLVYATRHVTHTALRLRDLESGEERWLAYPVQRDQQESRASRDAFPGMAFTPDSRDLVATYGGQLWRIPVDGAPPVRIVFEADAEIALGPEVDFAYPVEDTPTFVVKQIRDGVPSPTGDRVAFSALGRLYLKSMPDGEVRQLTTLDGNQHAPVWSPDGRWIAFVNWDFEEGGHLWRVASGGGAPQRLTREAAFYQQPAWSPDGERIVALQGPARAYVEAISSGVPFGARDLVSIPAAGGNATFIREVRGFSAPHFSNDPERIFAYGAGSGLISFRWDGTDQRTHLRVTGPPALGGTGNPAASLVRISPDGEQALAQHGMQLYAVHVPRVGRDGATVNVSNPEGAAFPVRKLTDVGGQFPAWSADGRKVHWSIGNAHVVYDLDVAAAMGADAPPSPSVTADPADAAPTPGDQEDAPEPERERPARYRPAEFRFEVAVERDVPLGTLLLSGARVLTMKGREVIESGDVLVRDGRIVSVGPSGTLQVPAGTEVMDLSGHTLLPGFVDTHAHLRAPFNVHRDQPWSYAANLAYGVTTTRDPQTGATDVLSYEDMVRAGRTLGPRIYSTGPGVFGGERIQSLDDARDVLRRYSDYYDTNTIKMYGAGNRQARQQIIRAARELGLMPTTEGSLDLALNLTMALDAYSGMEHNMPGFPLYNDVAHLVARSMMAYTPTILVTYGGPWAENYFYATEDVIGDAKLLRFTPFEEVQQKALRRSAGWFHPSQHTLELVSAFVGQVVEAGGRAGVGSHGQLQGLGYHWELWATAAGMTDAHEALRVATILGAQSLGLAGDLGSIEAGKLADLVVLSANPLENIRNTNTVRYVMLNGRLREGDTLDEVWPQRTPAGPFYWMEEAPLPATAAGIRGP